MLIAPGECVHDFFHVTFVQLNFLLSWRKPDRSSRDRGAEAAIFAKINMTTWYF